MKNNVLVHCHVCGQSVVVGQRRKSKHGTDIDISKTPAAGAVFTLKHQHPDVPKPPGHLFIYQQDGDNG